MTRKIFIIFVLLFIASCTEETQFTGFETEFFDETRVTESTTKTFILANPSSDAEQHVRGIVFDRGSNAAGHFAIDSIQVGNATVDESDIVIPPGSEATITVTYAPKNMETSVAVYGGWVTGEQKRWIPRSKEEIENEVEENKAIHRAIIEAVYDYPKEGLYYVQLVGEAVPGPKGEEEAGSGSGECTPGNGTACYSGGFALDIPQLAPGGPKPLEFGGAWKMQMSGGEVKAKMDDFPFALMYLRSEEISQLPSGTTLTLVLSGSEGVEVTGSFDGTRLTLTGVSFRIRAAMGELQLEQVKQSLSAMIDFDIGELELKTIKPFDEGKITLHLETKVPQNPSGNELFDQFLSGAEVIAIMEGELAF